MIRATEHVVAAKARGKILNGIFPLHRRQVS